MTQPPLPPVAESLLLLASALDSQRFPACTLYVVATPIGNIADISARALQVLMVADAIACEDTRNTAQLLGRYGIKSTLFSAHQHNEREVTLKIIQRLQAGERIVLISDAGTPAVSDPGAHIVHAVRAAGLQVVPIPGASAAITALSAAGMGSDQFHFVGFLPAKPRQRDLQLQALKAGKATLVMYEAPHRIMETVKALARLFGPQREIVIARELTKLFEQLHRCALSDAESWLSADPNRQRGEFVLLIEGETAESDDDAETRRILNILLEACPLSQAAALTARITGMKKNVLYEMALDLERDKP